MSIQPFGSVELAARELIMDILEIPKERVRGDMSYVKGQPFHAWFGLVPGGSTNETQGEWVLDIDIFDDDYTDAMDQALKLEAGLIGSRKVTSVMRIDNVYQNEGPAERPTADDKVFRIGATYVFTARRSG